MVNDRDGREVREGDFIKFRRSDKLYKIKEVDGELGSYGDGEFIRLKDTLKNFEVVRIKKDKVNIQN